MRTEILKLFNKGLKASEIQKQLGCSIGTVYWHISENTKKSVLANKKKRRREIKEIVKLQIFHGKCCLCGYNKTEKSLDFHHTESDLKENNISKLFSGAKISCLEEELKKVILVCKNCHGEIHAGLIPIQKLPSSPYNGESLYK